MVIKYRLLKLIFRRIIHLPKGINFFRYSINRIKFLYQKKKRKPIVTRPTSLMIELTNYCQLKCFICAREYQFGKDMDKGHMDLTEFKQLIKENHIYLDRIGLTGLGETLLYPQIIEAVEFIRTLNNGISIFISTNAYPKNAPEIISKLADKIDTLQISLDGIGSVFEHIRKRSDYNLYYENLEKLTMLSQHNRMTVKFNMVVFEENYKQMKDVIELAYNLNVNELFFNTFNLVATNLDLNRYDFYKSSKFLNEFNEALQLARELGIYVGYHDLTAPKGFRHCVYPWDDFYISWNGYLVPCCAKPFPKEMNFGNVFSDGLMPSLNSKKYINFRNLSNQNITPDFCKGCHKIN